MWGFLAGSKGPNEVVDVLVIVQLGVVERVVDWFGLVESRKKISQARQQSGPRAVGCRVDRVEWVSLPAAAQLVDAPLGSFESLQQLERH